MNPRGSTMTTFPKDARWVRSLTSHPIIQIPRTDFLLSAAGNLIQLPDQRILLLNGAAQGSEGYGWDDFALNQSYAQGPRLSCRYFTPAAPTGSQWDEACGTSTIPRMYHSTATLLYDGSVFVAGSNPNVDVSASQFPLVGAPHIASYADPETFMPVDESNNASYVFHTEYRVERFYPVRPDPSFAPTHSKQAHLLFLCTSLTMTLLVQCLAGSPLRFFTGETTSTSCSLRVISPTLI